ncbi:MULTISPECIES: hypothetical protein [Halorubrum]|uniref:hypothetical protein n=1 Tax=Halorubrum TaxID=56688 RepID=UPI00135F177B|nr:MULTISPECIES: hypothetical protein [Halorubrum]
MYWSPPALSRVQFLSAGVVTAVTVAYSVAIVGSAISALVLLSPLLLVYLVWGFLKAA